MDIKNGIPQSLATFSIASLGERNWCVTRPQEGHKYPFIILTSPIDRNSLMAEKVDGSGHPKG